MFFNYSTCAKVKVKDIMTLNPIVIPGTTPIEKIEEIFSKNNFWSIYVGDHDHYIGIVTRDDFKSRSRNKSRSAPAFSIMSQGVFDIDENADIGVAETILYKKRINGLALTRNGKHCGIITRYDIKNKSPVNTNLSSNIPPLASPANPPSPVSQPMIEPNIEGSSRPMTWVQKLSNLITTSPKDRKIEEKLEKVKGKQIDVKKKIEQKISEIHAINENIQLTYDKAKKSSSDPETIFFAKEIKHKQSIVKSRWETVEKLQRIQHYYDQIVAIGDLSVNLKDFGLGEFSEEDLEKFVIGTKIDSQETDGKIGGLNGVISSTSTNYDTNDEDLKDILAEIRINKK